MELVHDDVTETGEQSGDLVASVDELGFERLGSDEQDAGWVLDGLALVADGHVAVPPVDCNIGAVADHLKPVVLVVDQGFERGEIQHLDPRCRRRHGRSPRVVPLPGVSRWPCGCCVSLAGERGTDRKEGSLGLPGRGGSRDDDVGLLVEDGADRPFLGVVERGPPLFVHPPLHGGVQP
ncbi:MAG TPA: hypothetical protein VNS19_21670 [Acidimicrobiales bacterium]|nr:hypothetical protein [Acidimicrobiales bacterium]